jgi:DNA-binding NarL/FixJ family response regulator
LVMDRLTPEQRDTLAWACRGLSNEEIAERVYREPSSVRNRLTVVYDRLGVKGVANPRVAACVAFTSEAREGDGE